MGKLFSKPDRKRARSNSDPVRKFGKPVVKDDSMKRHTFDPRLLENKDSNNSWKGLIGVKNEHSGPVNTLTAINPKYCISGGKDALIILQNVDIEHIMQKWNEHTKEITKLQSRNSFVASASRDLSIKIWSIEQNHSLCSLQGHSLVVNGIDFNVEGTKLCSGSRDNTVRIWDIETRSCIMEEKVSRNLVTDMKWIKSDYIIAQTSEDKMLKLWDARNLEVVHSFPPQNQIQTCCDVSGIYCITGNNGFGGKGCEISLWDLRQRSKLQEFRGHSQTVSSCTFVDSPISTRSIASCSHDGTICLWQESQRTPICREQLNVGTLTSIVELNKDTLICGSFEEGIRLIRRAVSGKLVPV